MCRALRLYSTVTNTEATQAEGKAEEGYLKMKRIVAPASLLPKEGKLMSKTLRCTCLATALAIMVLPTPLAPWKSNTKPPAPPTAGHT